MSKQLIEQIKKNSAELQRLLDLMDDARSIDGAVLERARAEFQQNYKKLIAAWRPELMQRVRENNPEAITAAILFLQADPYHMESGYLKDDLWRWLQHCDMSDAQKKRIEKAALQYLNRRITREFWTMCKAMSRLGSSSFWIKVSAIAHKPDSPETFRARCLLTHGADIHAGAKLRRQVHHDWMMKKFNK